VAVLQTGVGVKSEASEEGGGVQAGGHGHQRLGLGRACFVDAAFPEDSSSEGGYRRVGRGRTRLMLIGGAEPSVIGTDLGVWAGLGEPLARAVDALQTVTQWVQDLFDTGCHKRGCPPRPAEDSLGDDPLIVEPASDEENVAIVLRGHLCSPRCVAWLKTEFSDL
jgi:hypothetical protein